eukprot:5317725-Lingulodinium_polyedra.AAC.1
MEPWDTAGGPHAAQCGGGQGSAASAGEDEAARTGQGQEPCLVPGADFDGSVPPPTPVREPPRPPAVVLPQADWTIA